MKRKFLILVMICISLIAVGQNYFFIGDKNYLCTDKFILESNSFGISHDLEVLIAKNGELGMIVVST